MKVKARRRWLRTGEAPTETNGQEHLRRGDQRAGADKLNIGRFTVSRRLVAFAAHLAAGDIAQ